MRALLATMSLALMTGTAFAAPVPVVASFSILGDMVKEVGGESAPDRQAADGWR